MSKKKAIGIDLGTSKCCVGVVLDGKVVILENERGNKTTPSYVAFTDTERLIGDDAKDQATLNPDNTVSGVKMFMCKALNKFAKMTPINAIDENGEIAFQVTYKEKKHTLLPQQLSAMLLTKMKMLAEDHLKCPVTEAVISVPASFTNAQRQATKDAAAIAGLKVLALISEPTAAAIAYQVNRRIKGKETIVVVDFGGGKLDVSVVTLDDDHICVNGVSGSTDIGGNIVDEMLMSHIVNKYKENKNNQEPPQGGGVMERLRSSSENIKRKLSILPKVQEALDCFGDENILRITMNRDEFKNMLPAKIRECLIGCVDDSLKVAGVDRNQISRVLLVGGSTRMIVIQEWLQEHFKRPIDRSVNPDEAVAYGASVQAALLSHDNEVKELVVQGAIGTNFHMMKDGDSGCGAIFGEKYYVAAPSLKYTPASSMKRNKTYHVYEEILGKRDSFSHISSFFYSSDLSFSVDKSGIFHVSERVDRNADGSYKWRDILSNILGKLPEEKCEKFAKQEEKFRNDDREEKSRTEAMANLESLCFYYQSDLEKNQKIEPLPESIHGFTKQVSEKIDWLNSTPSVSVTECLEAKEVLEKEYKKVLEEIRRHKEQEKERVAAAAELVKYCLELPFTLNEGDKTIHELRLSDTVKFLHKLIVEWAAPNSTLSKEECNYFITTLKNKLDEKNKLAVCTNDNNLPTERTLNSNGSAESNVVENPGGLQTNGILF